MAGNIRSIYNNDEKIIPFLGDSSGVLNITEEELR